MALHLKMSFAFMVFFVCDPIQALNPDLAYASNENLSENSSKFAVPSSTLKITRAQSRRTQMEVISQTILNESLKFNFDPLLLMSMIQIESGFSPKKRGTHGEIGLMQLKPSTAEWIAKRNGIPWKGPDTLEDPVTNIRLGSAYLSFLRESFPSEYQLYLSAYNMGTSGVRRAIKNQTPPKAYTSRVLRQYHKFYSKLAHSGTSISL